MKKFIGKYKKGGGIKNNQGFIEDNRGQWAHPGKPTLIKSSNITMKGVPYPVLGTDDLGNSQMMYPGAEYTFPGNQVYEIPMAQNGTANIATRQDSLDLLLNSLDVLDYYNNRSLDRYVDTGSGDLPNFTGLPSDYHDRLKRHADEFREINITTDKSTPTNRGQFVPKSDYRRDVDNNKYYQREFANAMLDTRAPMTLYDRRIEPTSSVSYANVEQGSVLAGDRVSMQLYDPLSITPWLDLTPEQQQERLIRFGTSGTPHHTNNQPAVQSQQQSSSNRTLTQKTPPAKRTPVHIDSMNSINYAKSNSNIEKGLLRREFLGDMQVKSGDNFEKFIDRNANYRETPNGQGRSHQVYSSAQPGYNVAPQLYGRTEVVPGTESVGQSKRGSYASFASGGSVNPFYDLPKAQNGEANLKPFHYIPKNNENDNVIDTSKITPLTLKPESVNFNIDKNIELLKFLEKDKKIKNEIEQSNVEHPKYKINKGDTLGKIAQKYNISVQELAKLNGIENPNKISIGQELVLPAIEKTNNSQTRSLQQNQTTSNYKIQSGDTLGKIAKRNNISVEELAKLNNIDNPNKISIGQELKLPVSEGPKGPGWYSVEEIEKKRQEINQLENKDIIVQSQLLSNPEEKYIVINKSTGQMTVYQGDKVVKGYEVLTGDNAGDAQTVTQWTDRDKDGIIDDSEIDWRAGNFSTGAGKFKLTNSTERGPAKYEYAPSFNMTNDNDLEVAMAIHGTPRSRRNLFNNNNIEDNRASSGCINGKCEDLKDLYKMQLPKGTPIYVLPDDDSNYFEMVDGKAVFRVPAKEKAKYDTYIDKRGNPQKGQGVNDAVNTLTAKPIKIDIDEERFQDEVWQWEDINDPDEYEYVTKPFINALEKHKSEIMTAAKIPGHVYNEIAKMAFGIFGAESHYGDDHAPFMNAAKAINKLASKKWDYTASSPDVWSKHDFYQQNKNHSSVGLTQIKYIHVPYENGKALKYDDKGKATYNGKTYTGTPGKNVTVTELNPKEEEILKDLGITKHSDWLNPEKAAIGTVALLGHRYNMQLSKEEQKDIWKNLPRVWNADEGYASRVKNNSNYINIKQYDNLKKGGSVSSLPKMQGDVRGSTVKLNKSTDQSLYEIGSRLDRAFTNRNDFRIPPIFSDAPEGTLTEYRSPFWGDVDAYDIPHQERYEDPPKREYSSHKPPKQYAPYEETHPSYYYNPKNWNVPRYDDRDTREEAFRDARNNADKEFLYRGERYHTESDMSNEDQMRVYGITNEQRVTNPSQARINLGTMHTMEGYSMGPEKVINAGLHSDPTLQGLPGGAQAEQDALRLYLGLPQIHNTFKGNNDDPRKFELNNYAKNFSKNISKEDWEHISKYGALTEKDSHARQEADKLGNEISREIAKIYENGSYGKIEDLYKQLPLNIQKKLDAFKEKYDYDLIEDDRELFNVTPYDDLVMGTHDVSTNSQGLKYSDTFDFDTYSAVIDPNNPERIIRGSRMGTSKNPLTNKIITENGEMRIPVGSLLDKFIGKPYTIEGNVPYEYDSKNNAYRKTNKSTSKPRPSQKVSFQTGGSINKVFIGKFKT